MDADSLPIVDCHVHFVDVQVHSYPIFQQRSAALESLVGDYSTLPRRYLPEDYLKEAGRFKVVKTIWAEFMSDDPVGEATLGPRSSHVWDPIARPAQHFAAIERPTSKGELS